MGYDVLSMNATNLLMVKWALSGFSLEDMKSILNQVLKMDNAYLIKNLVDEELRKAGFGQVIRSR